MGISAGGLSIPDGSLFPTKFDAAVNRLFIGPALINAGTYTQSVQASSMQGLAAVSTVGNNGYFSIPFVPSWMIGKQLKITVLMSHQTTETKTLAFDITINVATIGALVDSPTSTQTVTVTSGATAWVQKQIYSFSANSTTLTITAATQCLYFKIQTAASTDISGNSRMNGILIEMV